MKLLQFGRRLLPVSALALVAALSFAHAQQEQSAKPTEKPSGEYKPSVGQAGKDVVWVPTGQAVVDKMLDIAKVTADDYVVDLGSGDGRTVITAAKRGARALGIEFNPNLVELSKRNSIKEGVADKAKFIKADIFKSDFSKATVITLFLLPDLNVRLRPKILNMKPGVRVVSNSFTMGDWTADEQVTVTQECPQYCNILFWIVPAKVQGKWKTADGELVLGQKYQMLSGTLTVGKESKAISDGKMTGGQIAFAVGDTRYTGRVEGNTIKGVSKTDSGEKPWTASRQQAERRAIKKTDKKRVRQVKRSTR